MSFFLISGLVSRLVLSDEIFVTQLAKHVINNKVKLCLCFVSFLSLAHLAEDFGFLFLGRTLSNFTCVSG